MFQKVFQAMTTNNIYYKKINVHARSVLEYTKKKSLIITYP